ncbi:FAD-binding oxidoreductase [Nocardioides sp. NPDC059952]|uniref:FAD-binding oxidoreductase n=1 Tax=Nocardioides sp. NPDC059952 TaxID=3347014 RepID=UPI0036536384
MTADVARDVAATAIAEELVALLPAGAVLTDPDVVEGMSRDQAAWAPYGRPAAVVRATSTDDVVRVVRACLRHGVPVVARGAGTGLSGGANALDGCVVVSLERMNRVLEINPLERLAVVQPGVVNDVLRETVAEHELWYPPDPASSPWSTIGGNVATNAGGLCCVKYGVTRDYVLQLEVVTGRGEVVRLGRRTAKGVAGYDLMGLVIGSEGTLGIVTEVTVRLRPLPAPAVTVAGFFSSVVDAGDAVRAVSEAGLVPSALELVDRHCLQAVDAWKNMGLSTEAEVVLLGRFDDPGETGEALAEQMVDCFRTAGATWAERSTDEAEAEALFAARRLAYPALERLGPVLTEDVCVPKEQVPEMLARIERIAIRQDIVIANIAHAGDGNLHPLLVTPPGEEAARARAEAAFDDIIADAIALGGTVTGEHGVGLLKRDGLTAELSAEVVEMHRAVKAALDPAHLLNPGKVFSSPPTTTTAYPTGDMS